MGGKKRILVLSGYDAGSHRRWREQLAQALEDYHWQALTLPPRFFRWRIRGNPLSWLDEPLLQQPWDLILATSMVDLATLKGLHPHLARVPTILYMHENQFAYPDSGHQHASVDPQMVNLYAALAADRVLFNSAWNRDSFMAGIRRFTGRLPDRIPDTLGVAIEARSHVVPVPIEDSQFLSSTRVLNRDCPHLLWNHRWEYDKGPERLLNLLRELQRRGQAFRLSVVGEQFRSRPEAFDQIHQEFAQRIEHWGFLRSRRDYDRLLTDADVVISTALHDFQGLAMLEAMAAGCLALAPARLAYPEYVPSPQCYQGFDQDAQAEAVSAADCLQALLASKTSAWAPDGWRRSRLSACYRQHFEAVMA